MTPATTQPLRSLRDHPIALSPGQRCPYCREGVREEQLLLGCPECLTVLHYLCAADGRCTTLGCANGPRVQRGPGPRRSALVAPARRRARWHLPLIALACFGVGFAALYTPPEPYVTPLPPPPPPPPLPPLRVDVGVRAPRLTARLDGRVYFQALFDLQVLSGMARARDAEQPLRVWVQGQPAAVGGSLGGATHASLPISAVCALPGPSGTRTLSVAWSWAGQSGSQQVSAYYQAPQFPRPAPVVRDLVVPTRVESDLVIVRGVVVDDVPWADVTIQGPMGQVELPHLPPGPFTGAVTLPGPGRHQVVVTMTGPDGRARVARQTVVR